MSRELVVLIAGQRAGRVCQAESGALSFTYDDGYAGIPLSLSMPVSNQMFGDKVVRPFLFGLLPDSFEVRRSLGRELGVSADNPWALLAHVGLDCPGAVQLCAEEDVAVATARAEMLVPMAECDIAARLRRGRGAASARWETDNERWSLGGQQAKFALRREGDGWYSCEGAAATTHIFKPGISDLKLSALNEYVCLKLAAACGIPAERVDYLVFEDEPAIVATRYDRVRDDAGRVRRLHQEDFCQVLGVLPERKYPEEGGPGAADIVRVCKRTGAPAASNLRRFFDMLFFNYLIGAPDAHAKNYSLLIDCNAAYLAPLYDVASLLPYAERPFDIKLAMGVAGENRVGRLSARRLGKFADANGLEAYGLTGDVLAERLAALAGKVPAALEAVLAESGALPGIDELGSRLLPLVAELCERSTARLG
ncbi:type II toxin-antitoxin system HipA family toxin [Adlercreutzia sp. R25]|uniref:type II toxin-antitoxin system HipA family toxin n=1 Tax=Adlercreutzia shanghongiae TaxID=3111773 RepID=UPI002DBAF719|nr:type II toxin-antitoxin system HipA family toxin [Adlercreutzia sp. R25]MEC4272861.1 type II toxin-antitoxin system HipA family toxin [Adlercreutzia sp. R25]